MILPAPAHLGSAGQSAVRWFLLLLLYYLSIFVHSQVTVNKYYIQMLFH